MGSAVRSACPPPARIAVTGRQNPYVNFESQQPMRASDATTDNIAKRRAAPRTESLLIGCNAAPGTVPLQHGVNPGAANEYCKIGLVRSAGAADRASVRFGLSVVMQPYIAVERRWRREPGTAMDWSSSMGSRRESMGWRAGGTPEGLAANCLGPPQAESN